MCRRFVSRIILLCTIQFLLCFQVLSQDTDTIDPSGVWSNHEGTLSLLLTGDALSFSYSSVFGEDAHICSGAGVAGLEGQNVYHNVDEQGTIAFEISNDKVRMYVVEGIPSFCGAGWMGATFNRNRFTPPKRVKVKANKSRFYVVMPSPPWERKGYVVAGNVVEVVPVNHDDAEQYVLARYRGKHAFSVGLLLKNTLSGLK
ncbi:MAG: hypothetical protein WBQ23_04860 [Bacteroidota bacterium]